MRGYLGYLGYRLFAALFGALPEGAVRRLGRFMGRVASYVVPAKRRMAQRHMRRVLGPDADARAAAREMFASYGRYWAEVFWVRPHRRAEISARVEVDEDSLRRVRQALDEGRGVILALPHIGNWEAAGAGAESLGFRVLAVAEALKNHRVAQWFIDVRNALGIDVVLTAERGSTTRALIERLRGGGAVALLCDRDLRGTGVPVEFFGETTTLPAGPAALADRTGAALFPIGVYFHDGPGHYMYALDEVVIPDAEKREERVAAATQVLAKGLEEIISRKPTQWHLLVPNWPSDR